MSLWTLAVIPSDLLDDYIKGGIRGLGDYYNPLGFFQKVYVLSPLEKTERIFDGMQVIPTRDRQLPGRIKALGIDIVRAYGGYWPADMACRFRVPGIPVVVSLHDRRSDRVHPSARQADAVFAVSEETRMLACQRGVPAEKVWLLPNRVDLSVMSPQPPELLTKLAERYPYRYRLVHAGRRSPEKNRETLIRALAILGKDYCLLALGNGDDGIYQALASQEGVSARYFPVEAVPHDELPLYFSLASCVCQPSLTEAMSSVVIEAMACGAAVVASPLAAASAGLQDGVSGSVIDAVTDPKALAAAIRCVCEDAELKVRLGQAARHAAAAFSKEVIDPRETALYAKLLAQKGKK